MGAPTPPAGTVATTRREESTSSDGAARVPNRTCVVLARWSPKMVTGTPGPPPPGSNHDRTGELASVGAGTVATYSKLKPGPPRFRPELNAILSPVLLVRGNSLGRPLKPWLFVTCSTVIVGAPE